VVVDVKPEHLLARPEVAFTFEWARRLVEARGWRYEVWIEPRLPELENLRFLAGYRRSWLFDVALLDRVRAADVVGTRFRYDGETVEVIEIAITATGNEVVLKDYHGRLMRLAVRELLLSDRARVIPDGPGPMSGDPDELASVTLAELTKPERDAVLERAAHIREVLTGYRSGSAELACEGEPSAQFDPGLPLTRRYESKAAELGVSLRTIKQWVADFRLRGEAGLARSRSRNVKPLGRVDDRWAEIALEVMAEHTDQSRPSRTMVAERANARVAARFGEGVVKVPSRATAFRVLAELERRHPTFRLSTKRNRDIADRPKQVYGKLRPTRPGEYLVMDTTRLDVFAFDPFTAAALPAANRATAASSSSAVHPSARRNGGLSVAWKP
jgi:hypothetical protein